VNLAARIAADITILGLLLAIFFSDLLLSTFYRQNNHLLLPAISGIPPGLRRSGGGTGLLAWTIFLPCCTWKEHSSWSLIQ
jgi:hypothetical protein